VIGRSTDPEDSIVQAKRDCRQGEHPHDCA
jgi:hypothetical protein